LKVDLPPRVIVGVASVREFSSILGHESSTGVISEENGRKASNSKKRGFPVKLEKTTSKECGSCSCEEAETTAE